MSLSLPPHVEVRGPLGPGYEEILTRDALELVARLARAFAPRIEERIAARRTRSDGASPLAGARSTPGEFDFLTETKAIRTGDWKVAPLPHDLLDRRVEITGPVDRKMIINALNSGANVFMADFEDATTPTWSNLVEGQINLRDAVRRSISLESGGKKYKLAEKTATLFVRPRGLHLPEKHVTVDGRVIPGALFDFGVYFFHNARALLKNGTGPYFYLPKLESHLEARIWNDVFLDAQAALGVAPGTIKATVLIETLPAAFEMHEILHELRQHSAGLNCGRWDYIFSFIKKRANEPGAVLPDRGQVTMDRGFLRAYSRLLIETCHRRGVHAMGGMAAQIPIKDDPAANEAALAKVRADKEREVNDGHDGTWVAHPGLVPIAKAVFDAKMKTPNQIDAPRPASNVGRAELLAIPEGTRTEAGLRLNVRVGVQYIEAWLRGQGCVPLYNLMEDAATAEISRAQVWQWLRHRADVDGAPLTLERYRAVLADELARFSGGHFDEARRMFDRLCTAETFPDFLTLAAYERID
jgi:malate synthase